MYNGTNPKALQSQRLLADSLIALIEEKAYFQITVFDICQRSGLSRQTFYNFFNSKEEILHFFLQKQFEALCNEEVFSLEKALEVLTIAMRKNKKMLRCLLENNLDGIITDELSKSFFLVANNFSADISSESIQYNKAMLSGAVSQLLLNWFYNNMSLTPHELTVLLNKFISADENKPIKTYADAFEDIADDKENTAITEDDTEEQPPQSNPMPLFLL